MALWAGSSINSTETAMVFNKIYDKKFVNVLRKKNAFYFAVTRQKDINQEPMSNADWKGIKNVTGQKVEVGILGRSIDPAYVADGADELAAVTLSSNYYSNAYGAMEFAVSHLTWTHPIPASQLDRYQGNELKTADFLESEFERIVQGYNSKFGTEFNTSQAPARNAIGGWPYAIDTANTYGTIDRSDSANADMRGLEYTSIGDLTLGDIAQAQIDITLNGGDAKFATAGGTVFGIIRRLLENQTQAIFGDDERWNKFGGQWCWYAGTVFAADNYAPSQAIGMFTPNTWCVVMRKQPFTKGGVQEDITKVDAYVVKTKAWIQLICTKCNENAYLQGITG